MPKRLRPTEPNITYYHHPNCQTQLEKQNQSETDAIDVQTNHDSFSKVYMFGEKSTCFKTATLLQNYDNLLRDLLENKTIFVDENFSVNTITLTDLKGDVVWKRPFEICENPKFIKNGASKFDVNQGQLKDCWFLAAVVNLTQNPELFSMVVPPEQSFTKNYAGIFHFRFWQYGNWVDVVIDDQLPTINDELIYSKSETSDEFWPSLLEKAYAKLHGSYKNLEEGKINEALEDLSGGLSEVYNADHPSIYDIIKKSYDKSSLLGCCRIATEISDASSNGIIPLHAYSITKIYSLQMEQSVVNLIRIRNPWGGIAEWNGPWSDHSPIWNSIPENQRLALLNKKEDGEFWIEVDDFQKIFTYLDICHLNPSIFCQNNDTHWNIYKFEGCWVPNVTAGGGYENEDTYASNPQYILTVKNNAEQLCNIIIGLMQKSRRDESYLELQLDLFQLEDQNQKLLEKSFFKTHKPLLADKVVGCRQLTMRVLLPAGRYCLVPNTGHKNQYGCYILRAYCESGSQIKENDYELGYLPWCHNNHAIDKKIFKKLFIKNKEVGCYSMKKALNKYFSKKKLFWFSKSKISFSKDTCQQIIALWDSDYSGTLDYGEFQQLMQDITKIKLTFEEYDTNNSGTLDGFELRNVLQDCGYKVNKSILLALMQRYGYNGSMDFEKFVICVLKLNKLLEGGNLMALT